MPVGVGAGVGAGAGAGVGSVTDWPALLLSEPPPPQEAVAIARGRIKAIRRIIYPLVAKHGARSSYLTGPSVLCVDLLALISASRSMAAIRIQTLIWSKGSGASGTVGAARASPEILSSGGLLTMIG